MRSIHMILLGFHWKLWVVWVIGVLVMHGGHQGRERIPRNFGPPTDDEPFRYEFAAPLGT